MRILKKTGKMKKEKFHIEYILGKVSRRSLWNQLTTSMGLSAWFAERVTIHGNVYAFWWNKEAQRARAVEEVHEERIRYHWLEDEDENAYFEFIIHYVELTGTTALEITDFAEPDEKSDSIDLWDTQVGTLKRTLGI